MTFETLMKVMDCGDKHGSAFKDILAYYGIEDNDLSHIDDEMAEKWLSRQKCKCWQKVIGFRKHTIPAQERKKKSLVLAREIETNATFTGRMISDDKLYNKRDKEV